MAIETAEDAISSARMFSRWKSRVLLSYSAFYVLVYMSRFNHWPSGPLIADDLGFSHLELGLMNALLLWGFGAGDLVHGRLAEAYGMRLWLLLGSLGTAALNVVTSFADSFWTFVLPWTLNGFVNAMLWSPGISMITQWWQRSQRGRAMGLIGVAAGGAMLLMWVVSGWTASEFGWRAAFRYPPLAVAVGGVALFLMTRDRPADAGLSDYEEADSRTAAIERRSASSLNGLAPYRRLMSDWRFVAASHVKGMENVVRYGLTTWTPLYYFEQAGLTLESTIAVTIALPAGYLTAPLASGYISDRLLGGRRSPMVTVSALISAAALIAIAFVPATSLALGAGLLFTGAFAMSLSMSGALAVDLAGRHMAGTASGVLDAHGYLYAGAQALVFSVVLNVAGSPWPIVFLSMAGVRLLSAAIAWRVRY
ncbi:MAG: MFS transporter [Chloroflexi bacterium]|nr:MFS transporter [Chloroflexota bacterium]MDA1298232.1 MFS transporter [Chloroflexota bacterium]